MSFLGTVGKSLLSLVPGGGLVSAGLDLVGGIADAVGGETGKKISDGAKLLTEGLDEAGQQPLSPEQQAKLQEAGMQHEEAMREFDLQDTQGGRDLAKAEIASSDEYVRRTRPRLLRIYGYGTIGLVVASVVAAFVCVLWTDVGQDEAAFLIGVLQWALPSIAGTFLLMFRVYTGKRTQEKLADAGMPQEGLLDKLIKFKTGGN
jgi:hypothetical protein